MARRPSLHIVAVVLVAAACSTGIETEQATGAVPATVPMPGSQTDSGSVVITPDELLAEALGYYSQFDLPEGGIPPGFIEGDRLFGECVAHFGFSVLEPDLAGASGVYYFEVGDQIDRINAVASACETALGELGIILPVGVETHGARYDAYLAVQRCLEANGYPTLEPPSLDAFLEDPDGWTPWQGMIGLADPMLPTPDLVASDQFSLYFESLEACPRP